MKSDIQYIDPKLLKLHPKFKAAFAIKPENVKAIADDMRAHGYDSTFPIICDASTGFVVDGHTRRAAAIDAGLIRVPVIYRHHESEQDAFSFIMHTQTARRNLDTSDIIRLILKDEKYLEAPNKKKYIASTYNVSIPKAGQIMAIMADGRKMAVVMKRNEDGTTDATKHTRARQATPSSPIMQSVKRITAALDAGELTADELEALTDLRAAIGRVLRTQKTA